MTQRLSGIAVVGMACRYPDAASPEQLWENAVAGRRAFRRLPDVRMRLADYWDPDPTVPDRFYARHAAVIEGYEFDRIRYRVGGSTYRSTDLTHWLALDVAAQALADAGFPMGEGLPRERTAVIVGNTLTGEFSRANQMRLRWPYVRRTVAAALADQGFDGDRLGRFLNDLEARYKEPFPAIDEDSLAGGLANTIAGRICNHFDLKGGGYTVDGACSSSLLSVIAACVSLTNGDCDIAVAGGVDLSIDPFEIVGFAKTGALATREMRVYDRGSNGFWPGEGCGMVVLMRESDARRAGLRRYARIAGWGISSDGKGGITRPEPDGYRLALHRAYQRAGFGIETVSLFEGHGTGTAVGDATELTALSAARRAAGAQVPPAVISSIKGMIGHTKAAAGVAGLIKAAMAVHHRVLPPAIGCVDPHPVLAEPAASLRVLRQAEPWPRSAPVRAGITAMGFGGINTHLVVENPTRTGRGRLDRRTRALASSLQDTELLVLAAASWTQLRERLSELIDFVPELSYAQLADLADALHRQQRDLPCRAAVLVSSPDQAEQRLRQVREALDGGETELFGVDGCFLGQSSGRCRVGFLFPGQGSGRGRSGGALRRRFAEVARVYQRASDAVGDQAGNPVATAVAQPRIVTGSLAGLRILSRFGLRAGVAVGHSLGEITALHWAGAVDEATLRRTAEVRGRIMTEHSATGTMASVAAPPEQVAGLLDGLPVVIAGYNGPTQTVVAGPVPAVETVRRNAGEAGLDCTRLAVSHAFHSPLVAPAAEVFGQWLAGQRYGRLTRTVVSTVSGDPLAPDTDIPDLLRRQITEPVRFTDAIARAAKDVDLFVEVGPGRVLTGLTARASEVPAVALDTDDESLGSLLRVLAAGYVMGAVDSRHLISLFTDRLTRPLRLGEKFKFFGSPCERAPEIPGDPGPVAWPQQVPELPETDPEPGPDGESCLDLVRRLVAERAELPLDAVHPDSRLLDDLHLSSITVGQVMRQATQQAGVPASQTPTHFATATVRELADTLEHLAGAGDAGDPQPAVVAGAAAWTRAFTVDLDETPLPPRFDQEDNGAWQTYGDPDHPLLEPLRRALERGRVGAGILVCLPEPCTERDLEPALRAAQAAVSQPSGSRFVLVQHDRGAAGMAKTLRLEAPQLRVTVVGLPAVHDGVDPVVDRVVAEVAATTTFVEVHYDPAGHRRVPILRPLPVRAVAPRPPLDSSDVLLVTGGGKGITAECALAVAVDTGARLALLGRSDPDNDPDLAANLRRMTAAGVAVHYARADVTDPRQVRGAVAEVTRVWGPVTAVLHGAGSNRPAGLSALRPEDLRSTFAPKITGLRAVLDAIDLSRLRLLVTFGSIIGRAGLAGEAHYATANEWLADLTHDVSRAHPGCRALCLEWSVWSGVGMGERLAVVESLLRGGVTPITPDDGVRVLRRLLSDPDVPSVVVVGGRMQGLDTLRHERVDLPLLRFVERPLIHYPGVELVTEVELRPDTDRYLADHDLDGNLLFPAVFGMEAMSQVAVALTDGTTVPVLEDVEFPRPIVVPAAGTTIRIAAVVSDSGDDVVDVVIRSADTEFAADHFRARVRPGPAAPPVGPPDQVPADLPPVSLDPAHDLYGGILFQGGRFQRLRRYHRAAARHVDVLVSLADDTDWFAEFLPDTLLLGDPGMRDALMHGNQVCVPDATLLPVGIERVFPGGGRLTRFDELRFCAVERSRDGDTYTYDIAVRTAAGDVVERWQGLRLKAVRRTNGRGPWVPSLLGPYLERGLDDLLGAQVSVVVDPADPAGDRRSRTALAVARALGRRADVRYRQDGRPEVDGDRVISASHGAGVTLCVAAVGVAGCDVEPVVARPAATWEDLLGQHQHLARFLAAGPGEDLDTAATRVWSAIECLRKVGIPPHAPLTGSPSPRDGWQVFVSGTLRIATFVTALRNTPEPVVFAVLSDGWS